MNPPTSDFLRTPGPAPTKVVVAAVIGNALEFFDFIAYSFFAVYIGKAFFPASTPIESLLLSLAVYGAGYLARPLGAILIAAYADRSGRKPAMLLSIGLMTAGTLGLAATPTFESVGVVAPMIVVACRLIQGLGLGGELGPTTAFLIEIAPRGRRGIYGSWQLASQGIATLIAGAVGTVLVLSLTPEQLQAWGWRVPFIISLLLIPVATYLRRAMPETLERRSNERRGGNRPERLRDHTRLITLGVLIMIGATVSTHIGLYMTTYAISTLKLPTTAAMAATVAVGLATLIFSLLGGWLSDRYGRKWVMLIPRVLAAALAYPAFMLLIEQRTAGALLAASAVLAALTAVSGAASLVRLTELLPRSVRALGVSFGYAIGVALFGGTTQLAVTWLIDVTGDPASPGWYVLVTSIIAVAAMLALPEEQRNDR